MIYYLTYQNLTNRKFIKMSQNLKAASHDSQNVGDGYLQPANDGGNLQHQLVRSA